MEEIWQKVRTEYITTDTTYRLLAEKYGLPLSNVSLRGNKEGWVKLREKHAENALNKALEADAEAKAERLMKMFTVSDQLLEKIQQAVTELDKHLTRQMTKTTCTKYEGGEKGNLPTMETVEQKETVTTVDGIIDRAGLKQITTALKDLKEVQMLRTELDRQEQAIRVALLQRQLEQPENTREPITVQFLGGEEEWTK